VLEIIFVLLTAVAFQVSDNVLHRKAPFIAAAGAFWAGYILFRWAREPSVLREWGLRRENLRPASAAALVVLLVGLAGTAGVAASRGSLSSVDLPHRFWLLLALYPAWGLLQQFMLNAMVARNLIGRLPAPGVVLLTAVLFGAVHLPDVLLATLTAAAALVWVPIYLRWRNLWPLGVCHGLLAAVVYFVLLRRDPLG
jgi:hypothetical protein